MLDGLMLNSFVMRRVFQIVFTLALILCVLAGTAVGWYVLRSPDPTYAAYELVYHASFHRYDALIRDVAKRRGLDPMVVKAVVWRESRFRPGKVGLDGERGLMQITDAAAREWVKGEKIASFIPGDLFDPKVNLEAGSWLLARALHRYQDRDDPLPFALAEYNAGRSRVARWASEKDEGETGQASPGANSRELLAKINIPSTRHYVDTVQNRVHFYRQRGEL